ncbi:MAG TPA: ABC transporter substrate-binding protein [Minicystis sp.]|nr:ABC transporter substrate-binding protein [Minicystis sp.]
MSPFDRRLACSRRDALSALAASFAALAVGPGCTPRDDGSTASLWFAYGGKNREVLLELVAAFHASQDRHRIHATYQGDYFEALAKLRTAIAAGAAPTLTHVVGEVVPYLAEAGVLEPLTGLADLTPTLVPEIAQEGAYVNGGERPLVALPFNRSTPLAYVNGELFDRLGMAPPSTWDELRTVAARATVRRGSGEVTRYGFACPIDWWFWIALVGQAGAAVVGPRGEPTLGGAAGVEALRFWQTLVRVDRTMKPPPGRDYNAWQAVHNDFLAGRAAMIWTSTAFLRYLEENASFPVRAAPLPKKVRAAVPVGGTMFVTPKGARPGPRAAAHAFLRFMMQPAQATTWAMKTGYIPVAKQSIADLTASGHYAAHPNDRVAIDQLAAAVPWPWAPTLFRIQRDAVQPRLEEAVLADRSAEDALADARRAAEEP